MFKTKKFLVLVLVLISFASVLSFSVVNAAAEDEEGPGGSQSIASADDDASKTNPGADPAKGDKPPLDNNRQDQEVPGRITAGLSLMKFFAGLTDDAMKIPPFNSENVNKAIQKGNAFLLNIINLFYIIVLMIIALATIFDLKSYNAASLLPKLIIAILLSNFGLFFVETIANASQLLAQGLAGNQEAIGIATRIVQEQTVWETVRLWGRRAVSFLIAGVSGPVAAMSIPIQFLLEVAHIPNWFTLAFLMTAIILWLRIVGLWVFAIFAPFGVAFGVLPATQGFAKLYWRKVIAYAFIGPVLIFFIRMASIFYTSIGQDSQSLSGFTSAERIRDIGTVLILLIGVGFARKMSVEVANFTIGAFRKAFKGAFIAASIIGGAGVAAIAATAGSGAASSGYLARFFSRAGVSEKAQKRIGAGGRYGMSRLKASKLPGVSSLAAGAEGRFEELEKSQEAPLRSTSFLQKFGKIQSKLREFGGNAGLVDMAENDPNKFLTRILAEKDEKARAALALLGINKGVIDKNLTHDDDGNIKTQSFDNVARIFPTEGIRNILRNALEAKNPNIDPSIANISDPDKKVKALSKKLAGMSLSDLQKLSGQFLASSEGSDALKMAFAPRGVIRGLVPRMSFDDVMDGLKIGQRRAVGEGARASAEKHESQAKGSDSAILKHSDAAAERRSIAGKLGVSPSKAFSVNEAELEKAGVERHVIEALKANTAALKTAAANRPETYKNLSSRDAADTFSSITNINKVTEAIRNMAKGGRFEALQKAKEIIRRPDNYSKLEYDRAVVAVGNIKGQMPES